MSSPVPGQQKGAWKMNSYCLFPPAGQHVGEHQALLCSDLRRAGAGSHSDQQSVLLVCAAVCSRKHGRSRLSTLYDKFPLEPHQVVAGKTRTVDSPVISVLCAIWNRMDGKGLAPRPCGGGHGDKMDGKNHGSRP